jgi:glycosyltransferase involved in cell wall biosynthesis
MRRCRVFVCSSWEEGFGLPGLEALQCGAALATTDTKGSRDYAFHERTALVSPPRDTVALARNIIRLLGDEGLCQGLIAGAGDHIATTFPDWPEAGTRFADTLARLAGS